MVSLSRSEGHRFMANSEPETDEQLPRHSASEQPVTRGHRIAFQVWILFFLLIIAFTLFQFIATWLISASWFPSWK